MDFTKMHAAYETFMPRPLKRLLYPVASSPIVLRQFGLYILIGVVVLAVDVLVLKTALAVGIYRPGAVTLGIFSGAIAQFLLNKLYNFPASSQPVAHQVTTYIGIFVMVWLATVGLVELGVRLLGLGAIWARLLTLFITVPTGFLTSRYLIFGPGVAHMWQQRGARRKAKML